MIVNQTIDKITKNFRSKGHHTSHYQLKFNNKKTIELYQKCLYR